MKKREIFLYLYQQKKVRRKDWPEKQYVYLDVLDTIVNQDKMQVDINSFSRHDWEIYKLKDADLRNADLRDVNLKDINLKDISLKDTDIEQTKTRLKKEDKNETHL